MKALYDEYKHLLGIPYVDGVNDCYGLCRRYFRDNFDLELPNYARSADFFYEGIDLITPFLLEEGFQVIDVPLSKLERGDGLLMVIPSRANVERVINHVAVYVGNGMVLHHLYQKPSEEFAIDDKWKSRIVTVLRHPEVSYKNLEDSERKTIIQILPDHVKRRLGIDPEEVLGSDS